MKVWIIYDSKFGHCKKLAEILEELLERDCDLSVGYAKKISPSDVLAESPDAILIGAPIHFGKPSRVMTSWIKDCSSMAHRAGFLVGKTFAFTTWSHTSGVEHSWRNIFQKYSFAAKCYPQILKINIQPDILKMNNQMHTAINEVMKGLLQFLFRE